MGLVTILFFRATLPTLIGWKTWGYLFKLFNVIYPLIQRRNEDVKKINPLNFLSSQSLLFHNKPCRLFSCDAARVHGKAKTATA